MLNENIIVTVIIIITYPVYITRVHRIGFTDTDTHMYIRTWYLYVYLATIDTTPSAILLPNVAEVLRASFTA